MFTGYPGNNGIARNTLARCLRPILSGPNRLPLPRRLSASPTNANRAPTIHKPRLFLLPLPGLRLLPIHSPALGGRMLQRCFYSRGFQEFASVVFRPSVISRTFSSVTEKRFRCRLRLHRCGKIQGIAFPNRPPLIFTVHGGCQVLGVVPLERAATVFGRQTKLHDSGNATKHVGPY